MILKTLSPTYKAKEQLFSNKNEFVVRVSCETVRRLLIIHPVSYLLPFLPMCFQA